MPTTYCFVAAKSAGHILPALALCKDIKKNQHTAEIIFISTNTTLDQKILYNHPLINQHIVYELPNIPYRKPWRMPLFIGQFIYSFIKSLSILQQTKPVRVISTGGLIAVPVCLAARLLRIPIDLYELNAEPGSAIHWLAKLATHVYYCFDDAALMLPKNKAIKAQYPLYVDTSLPAKTHDALHFDNAKKTVFIVGGSQGSQTVNAAIKKILAENINLAQRLNIIHQIGGSEEQIDAWRSWYKARAIPAYLFSYEPTCIPYYKLADVTICRSGAGTLFELAALQKKYITIPLETNSTMHQVQNAQAMAKQYPHLVSIVRQQELITTNMLADTLTMLLQ